MLVTLQQALSSGYINSVITTIEKRFDIPSSLSGLIASSYEIGNVITVIFVSYLGSRRHIPVWIGIGELDFWTFQTHYPWFLRFFNQCLLIIKHKFMLACSSLTIYNESINHSSTVFSPLPPQTIHEQNVDLEIKIMKKFEVNFQIYHDDNFSLEFYKSFRGIEKRGSLIIKILLSELFSLQRISCLLISFSIPVKIYLKWKRFSTSSLWFCDWWVTQSFWSFKSWFQLIQLSIQFITKGNQNE